MTEETKKVVLPAHLMRRFDAFRIVKGDSTSYLIRDKLQGKTHDFEAWQFFILEVMPGADSFERLQTAFQDRFDRPLTKAILDEFLGSVADRKMFNDSAAEHPLLAPFMQRTYEVENGKAKPKSFSTGAAPEAAPVTAAAAPAPAPKPAQAAGGGGEGAAQALPEDTVLPAGVQDALGMDWRTTKRMLGLFNPKPLLSLLAPVLVPLRHLIYAVPLLVLASLFLLYQYSHLAYEDLSRIKLDVTLAEHLLYLFITVHVVVTLTAGSVAHAYKVSVDKVGVALVFGFMPRWVLKMTGAERLSRTQTMWLHGSTLIARMLLFSVGVLVWFNTRDSQAGLADFAAMLWFACGVGLLLESGNPLVKANGYYLLAAFLNEPHLRGKAFAAILNKMRGGVYRAADNTLLFIYGLLSVTYVILVVIVITWMLGRYVLGDLELGGSAILLLIGFVGLILWRNYVGLKQFAETFERQVQFDRWRSRTLRPDTVEGEVKVKKTSYWPRALVVCLVLLLFLPYPYEPGGPFLVYPVRKQVISTDVSGLVEEVYFDGGETVKKGTVLARLAHEDYQSQVKVLAARIEEQKSVIQNLKTLPKPEEVKLAEELLAVERARESFSREKVPRLEKLYKAGAVSFEEFETARKDHLTDLNQVAQKEAALALVKAPVTAAQIAAEESRLVSLQEEQASYQAKIQRTVLVMPFDGNILTLHLKDKTNSYLEKGAAFAALEYTGVVTVEIDVPEADMQFVKVGSSVRVRAVSYSIDREFEGKVTLIDRNVTPKSTGNVIKVIATIDNKDALLKTGMAGRAKIVGENMPVWRAFSLSMIRFFQVQVWSWIP